MKFLLFLVLAGFCAVQASDDLNINGKFTGSKLGNPAPRGWTKNWGSRPQIGQSKIVQGKKQDELALQVTTGKLLTPFYSRECPAKAGDILEIEAEVTGKGAFCFGYYSYDAGHKFLTSVNGPKTVVQPQEDDYKAKLQVKDVAGKNKTAFIRVMFMVFPNSNLTFSDVEAEFEDGQ